VFPEDWGPVGNLLVAVIQPPLTVGGLIAVALLSGYDRSPALTVAALIATGLLWLSGVFLDAKMGLNFLALIALLIALATAWMSVERAILLDRGVRTDCVVLNVTSRTETTNSYDGDGHWSTTTDTYYDHRLACDDPHVTGLTADRRLADDGATLVVDYDPLGRVPPTPADQTQSHDLYVRITVIALVAAVLLRVVAVIAELIHPF
jgi:hypothetical protein